MIFSMKIDILNCCVKSTLSYYHDFNDCNGSPPMLFFWHELDSTAEEKRQLVTSEQQT